MFNLGFCLSIFFCLFVITYGFLCFGLYFRPRLGFKVHAAWELGELPRWSRPSGGRPSGGRGPPCFPPASAAWELGELPRWSRFFGELAPLATSAVLPGVDDGEACASQYDTLPTTTSTLYSDLIRMGTYALFGGNVFGMFKLDRILAPLGDPGDPPGYPGGSPGIPTWCPRSCAVEIDSESTQNRPRIDSESAQILPRTIMNSPGGSPGGFPGWSPVSPDIHRGISRVFYFPRVLPEVSPAVPQAPRNRTMFEN